jgi:hypothetical protein
MLEKIDKYVVGGRKDNNLTSLFNLISLLNHLK